VLNVVSAAIGGGVDAREDFMADRWRGAWMVRSDSVGCMEADRMAARIVDGGIVTRNSPGGLAQVLGLVISRSGRKPF
jgi:hypothetical protein